MSGGATRQNVSAARARWAAKGARWKDAAQRVRSLWEAAEELRVTRKMTGPAVAEALHREAVCIALRVEPPNDEAGAALWATSAPNVQLAIAGSVSELGLLRRWVEGFPGNEPDGRTFHRNALAFLEADLALIRRRSVVLARIAAATLVVFGLATIGVVRVVERVRAPVDLAAGRPFTLSSSWAPCHPEENECGGFPMKLLFHTNEQLHPWFQLDLGTPAPQYSRLAIRNRTDVALMRCLPLVVEVSDDGVSFREVARQTEKFVDWSPTFPPQTARFIRLRTDRQSTLHLESVKVYQ